MRLLIDSHVLLWALNDTDLLGEETTKLLNNKDSEVYISVVSSWELGLKHKQHPNSQPYTIKDLYSGVVEMNGHFLELFDEHILEYETIVLENYDPFDGLLVAQSEGEGLVFVTADANILKSKTKYRIHNAKK